MIKALTINSTCKLKRVSVCNQVVPLSMIYNFKVLTMKNTIDNINHGNIKHRIFEMLPIKSIKLMVKKMPPIISELIRPKYVGHNGSAGARVSNPNKYMLMTLFPPLPLALPLPLVRQKTLIKVKINAPKITQYLLVTTFLKVVKGSMADIKLG